MGFLDWMRGKQTAQKSVGENDPAPPRGRFKQVGEPFRKGDRVIVYEPYHSGRQAKRPPHTPGIVDSVYHNGTLVSFERLGRVAGNAPIEDVRHVTEFDAHKFAKEFASIETTIEQRRCEVSTPESGRKTLPRPRPSWERGR